jgi:diadenosine tetraphosphatase ApaH/serine/threonine PP2A family protein phosphatase
VQPETDRDTLWFVSPDGSNLDEVVAGAKSALLAEGLAWFAQLEGLDNLLRAARHVPMDMDGTWGMGNFGSPHRLELISALEAATAPTRSLSG